MSVVLRDLGEVLFLSAFAFLAPLPIALWYNEKASNFAAYILCGLVVFFVGLAMKKFFKSRQETETKHAFLSTSLIWLLFSFFSALPFVLVQGASMSDGMFESMSALTTTGLSVLEEEVNSFPHSLVFWRNFTGWIGGLGIIVLALMGLVSAYSTSTRLFSAEGHDDSIKPNLKHTVKELWKIYLGITILGMLALMLVGMGVFDALNYSMSTVSTAGFNTTTDRLAVHPNLLVEIVLTIILLVGASNFSLHYFFLKKKSLGVYLKSTEFKAMLFLSILGGFLVLPKVLLLAPTLEQAARISFFHSFSAQMGGHMAVSTNFFSLLDDFTKLVFVTLIVIGGSSGSTAGGIKVGRFLLVVKQLYWKIREISLPKNTFFSKKFEGQEVDQKRLSEVNYFVVVYFSLMLFGVLFFTMQSFSLADSLLEVASAQGNAGLSVGITHHGMALSGQIVLFLLMWAGRLDIIPLFSFIGLALSLRRK